MNGRTVRIGPAELKKRDTNVTENRPATLVLPATLIYRPPAMKMRFAVPALAAGLFLLLGCGDDGQSGKAANDSSLVGGPCLNNSECDRRLCQTGVRFPGGVCTISCGTSSFCPSGSSCAETDAGWLCLVDCATSMDCRAQYACEPLIEAGTGGSSMVSVCITPAPAP